MKRALTIALVTVLLFAGVALAFGAAASASSAGPSGMVALGGDQISDDLPDGTDAPLRASDLEGNVYASDHAGSMDVVLTTPERAGDHLGDSGNVVADGDVAIVVSDDEHHDGRDVAVDAGVLDDALGHQPGMVAGTHSSGDEWTRSVEYTSGYAMFEIPEFSSNAVTFGGGITLSGDAADDGTTYEYELDSLEGIDDFAINATGVDNTAWSNSSGSAHPGVNTAEFDVGGTTHPEGPASGSPELVVDNIPDGDTFAYAGFDWKGEPGVHHNDFNFVGERFGDPIETEIYGDNPGEPIDSLAFELMSGSGQATANIYLTDDTTSGETLVKDGWTLDDESGITTVNLDETYDPGNADDVTIIVETVELPDSDYEIGVSHDIEDVGIRYYGDGSTVSTRGTALAWFNYEPTPAQDVSVTADDGETVNLGNFGQHEQKSQAFDVSADATELEIETSDGSVNWDIHMKEVRETVDPVVELNGYTTEYEGTLAEGETEALATNDAWLEEGENTVKIHTDSPDTGPSSLVGFEYSHDASSVTAASSVEATTWSEEIVANNTFPSAVEDADVHVPVHDRVTDIRELTVEVDGEETAADYELDGNNVTVELGDVDAGTEVSVEVVASKVQVFDGEIDVLEPTVEGDSLSSEIEVADIYDDGRFGVRVDGTETGERVHYASDESWSGESAHVEIADSGNQILRADDAVVGSTMTVESSPLTVDPQSGAIEAEVQEVGDEPRFQLRQGDTVGADSVEVTYYDTLSDERYVLWSETRDVEVDADRASSPVHFTTDGDSETYSILQRDAGGSDDPPGPTSTRDSLSLVFVFGGIAGVLISTTLIGRRYGVSNRLLPITAASLTAIGVHVLAPGRSPIVRVLELGYQSDVVPVVGVGVLLLGLWQLDQRTSGDVPLPVWLVVGVLSGIWALETLSPGVILGGLREGVSTMAPLLVAGGALGVGYFLRTWLRARREEATTPDTQVTVSGFGEDD